jgi:hypothetical protein
MGKTNGFVSINYLQGVFMSTNDNESSYSEPYIPLREDSPKQRSVNHYDGKSQHTNHFFSRRQKCQNGLLVIAPSIASLSTGVPLFLFGVLTAWPAIGVSAGAAIGTGLLEVAWAACRSNNNENPLTQELIGSVGSGYDADSSAERIDNDPETGKKSRRKNEEDDDWVVVPLKDQLNTPSY